MIKTIKKNEKGFTLVELVVVIAILAILAALLVPRIMGNVEEAERSRELANARTIASEITTHNALTKVNGGTAIPAGEVTSLTLLGRNNSDLPTEVWIVVDANGNATVTEVDPSP